MSFFAKDSIPRIDKCFISSIILLPIFFMYATPIPGFSVGDGLMILAWGGMLLKLKKVKIQRSLISIIIYTILLTLACLALGKLEKPTTSLRYIVYLMIMLTFPTVACYRAYVFKILNIAGIFAMGILIIQYIFLTFFNIIVPGVLTFLPLMDSALSDYNEGFEIAGRCMSIFAEPSHYAIYIVLFLTIRLLGQKGFSFSSLFILLLVSISIIMCSSFTGIICMIAVWALKIFGEMRLSKESVGLLFSFIAAFLVLFYIATMTSAGEYIMNNDIYEKQSMGRFSGFDYIFEEITSSTYFILFGNGMNDIGELVYLPGWPRLFYYFGFIGSIIYILSFFKCAKRGTLSFTILIVIAGLMIGTEMTFGPFIMPYMLVVMSTKQGKYIASI